MVSPMKIKVLYFASLREAVGISSEECELPDDVSTLGALRRHLAARGDAWQVLETGRNIRVALNQRMSSGEAILSVGDEVAFFPPVTGG